MSWKVQPLALAAILNIAAPEKEAFTLEQVLSAPFPVDLTAARQGGAVQLRGRRDIEECGDHRD